MKKKGIIRRVFPGGNTYKGFYSYYDYILGQNEAKRIMIIKGGPGVGKSSFMKKIGKYMEERGFDIEYHHCSSDNNSIDGVVIPQLGVALIDGTAPHVVDPKNPGAVDEIINLGNYWDEEMLVSNKAHILNNNSEAGRSFKRAYGYLSAAKGVYDNLKSDINEAIDRVRVKKVIEQLIKEIYGKISFGDKLGSERHLFGSAITPEGIVDYIETIINPNEIVFVLYGNYDSVQSEILKKIGKVALDKGYNVEYFHNHLIPEKVDHLVIKDIKIALTTKKVNSINYNYINVDECLNKEILLKREKDILVDSRTLNELIQKAVSNISHAKKLHDEMEKYYIDNMDFEKIDELNRKIIQRILKLIEIERV